MTQRLDDIGDFLRRFRLDRAVLARLEVRGERLAAFLDHPGDVPGELLDIDLGRCRRRRRSGRSRRGGRGRDRQHGSRRLVHRLFDRGLVGHTLPAWNLLVLEDYGPWFGHISGINLFEAILVDTLVVVHCSVNLLTDDVERAT
jgi:hypothetical protein